MHGSIYSSRLRKVLENFGIEKRPTLTQYKIRIRHQGRPQGGHGGLSPQRLHDSPHITIL